MNVTINAEEIDNVIENLNCQPVMIRGKLLKTLLGSCTNRPSKDDMERPLDSIAIGEASIAATDAYICVVIGEPEESYTPTRRNSARLEAERENIYGECVDFANIERFTDPTTGETAPYPNVQKVLSSMDTMRKVGSFRPELLKRAASIAMAANAGSIDLYQNAEGRFLGIRFTVMPDEEQLSLFENGAEEIPSVGILTSKTNYEGCDEVPEPEAA